MSGDASTPVAVGQLLAGKYRIERVLGAGGMGVVVAATHEELDQHVAIKFLLPAALANADVVARFKREARAAVKIHSEHVARVIDVGTLDTGAPYMVMEYLEGGDLAQKIAEVKQLAVGEVALYVLEACEALAEAHAAGIVHRDLKPANLFLARRADKTAMVKVLDFGISKSPVGTTGGITSTQAVMGSPYYMSPEQLMSAKHVDQRADIWSLGIVMYESLVGVPPYTGDTMPEIVAKILQAPTPSVCAARQDVSPELDAIIARCLAKSATDRFADVAELAAELVAFTPSGQRSVDRISRILGAPSTRSPRGDVTAALPLQKRTTPTPALPATTSPAWTGSDLATVPKKSNTALFVIAAALGVVAVGAVIALTRHPTETAPASVGIVAAATPTTSATDLPTIAPPPIDTPLATTTPSAAPILPSIQNKSGGHATTATTRPGTIAATLPPPATTAPPPPTPTPTPTVTAPAVATTTTAPPPPPPPTQTSGTLHMIIK